MTYKYAIFDMDGTLTDSMERWNNIYIDLFGKLNLKVPDGFLMRVNHLPMEDRIDVIINEFNLKITHSELRNIWLEVTRKYYSNLFKIKPYMLNELERLYKDNYKMVIATASVKECADMFIKANALEKYFIGYSSVSGPKSDPNTYKEIANKYGFNVNECIVYEDSLIPLKTAKEGGFTICAVQDNCSKKDEQEILKISDYNLGF